MATTDLNAGLHESAFAMVAEADIVGVAPIEQMRGTPLYDSAVSLLPGARSMVVVGMEMFDEVVGLVQPDQQVGVAAARDLYEPHVAYICGRLNRCIYDLAKTYRGAGFRALPLPARGTPSDARFLRGIVSFKHAAVQAGLGKIGRSSLLITPKFGPRVRLACLLTDADIPATKATSEDPCEDCGEFCVANCPANALEIPDAGQPYAINRFACSTYLDGAGECTTCLSACPAGKK